MRVGDGVAVRWELRRADRAAEPSPATDGRRRPIGQSRTSGELRRGRRGDAGRRSSSWARAGSAGSSSGPCARAGSRAWSSTAISGRSRRSPTLGADDAVRRRREPGDPPAAGPGPGTRSLVIAIGDPLTARLADRAGAPAQPAADDRRRAPAAAREIDDLLRARASRRVADPEAEAAFELARDTRSSGWACPAPELNGDRDRPAARRLRARPP